MSTSSHRVTRAVTVRGTLTAHSTGLFILQLRFCDYSPPDGLVLERTSGSSRSSASQSRPSQNPPNPPTTTPAAAAKSIDHIADLHSPRPDKMPAFATPRLAGEPSQCGDGCRARQSTGSPGSRRIRTEAHTLARVVHPSRNPALTASFRNILTVSSEYSSRSLPTELSFFSSSCVTVII